MKSYIQYLLFITLIAWVPSQAQAQGIPVYDASSFAQLVTQLDQMAKEYQKQLEQLDEAIKQTDALTGSRNMGDVANGALEQQLRQYLPNTWADTMGHYQCHRTSGRCPWHTKYL